MSQSSIHLFRISMLYLLINVLRDNIIDNISIKVDEFV